MEGRTVSHYRVMERLGGGSMGVVYKAIDTRLDRPVALKFLPPELMRDDEARLRLIQEAKAASALDHPNICTVHDVDTTPEGQSFIVMSYYDGETLKRRVGKGPMPVVEALDIAIQVATGLAKAHAAGIVHRDIKPANLMITADSVVKIVDFGVAKVLDQTGGTQSGMAIGTVAYMSPEQVNGEPIDGRTDVWSLGVTLYEMLSGRTPFEGDHPLAVMKAIDTRQPAGLATLRADLPSEAIRVVDRSMQKSRDQRSPRLRSSPIRTTTRPRFGWLRRSSRTCRTIRPYAICGPDSRERSLSPPRRPGLAFRRDPTQTRTTHGVSWVWGR